ncbi:MAG: hypothetical protein Kow0042_09190 [Calditrichia bacterium]
MEVFSEVPNRFAQVKVVYWETPRGMEGRVVTGVKDCEPHVLLKLLDIDNRETAKGVVGKTLWLPEEEIVQLPEDTYFIHDLIGLEVFDIEGNYLGQLTDVIQMSGNDVYVVHHENRERLIPAVAEFVKMVDVSQRKMVVKLWEGM